MAFRESRILQIMNCSRILLAALACLSVSCADHEKADAVLTACGDGVVEACFETGITGMGYATRSILPEETIETKVSQVTLVSYDSEGHLTDARYYQSGFSSMKLYVSNTGESSVYALVNMGDMTGKFPDDEKDVSSISYDLSSYDEVAEAGIPMSGVLRNLKEGASGGVVPVDRLFAKICVRILHKGLEDSEEGKLYVHNMCNRSLFIRQANKRLQPFGTNGSRALSYRDIMAESDYNPDMNDHDAYQGRIPDGGLGPGPGYFQDTTFVFYVPENVQGRLLPSNNDPFGKVYENIRDLGGKSYSDICTYVEFNAWKEGTQGYQGSVMYRYYLGADNVSDFSIIRNKRYDLTLDFTEEGLFVDSWKVTRGDDWDDNRTLRFVDEPFEICPGGTEDVMIHFHRFASYETSSENRPDLWEYEVSASAMSTAGLSCSFNPTDLKTGENGYRDFFLAFKASETAAVGRSVPIRIRTMDGEVVDETVITIVNKPRMKAIWDYKPEYVSQIGYISVDGYEGSALPLTIKSSDNRIASCSYYDEDTFRVIVLKEGDVNLTVSSSDGSESVTLPLTVKAPALYLGRTYVELNPDGRSVSLSYSYLKDSGEPLDNYESGVFAAYLKPKLTGPDYFAGSVSMSEIVLFIDQLTVSGTLIEPGGYYTLDVSAANCKGAGSKGLSVKVTDPFAGIDETYLGDIDDYTLFTLSGTDADLRSAFASSISSNVTRTVKAPVPDADVSCVSVALTPRWQGSFSYANDVYSVTRDPSSGLVTIRQNGVTSSSRHSAGKHDLMLSVKNRHSQEKLDASCGWFDIYVHTAIGAEASFGKQRCAYSLGGITFAGVYNQIVGRAVFYPNSTSWIHYMDVTMKFLTPVSGVSVFEKVRDGNLSFDAADMLRPGKSDGATDTNTRLVYSVCANADSRMSVCGEPGGRRSGIGRMLYRALYMQTFDNELSDTNLKQYFFGYLETSVPARSSHAPSYTIHDMNKGSSFTDNIVTSRSAYFFSPSSCSSYRDSSGNGYHVVHFLETVVPKTCGWVNLL